MVLNRTLREWKIRSIIYSFLVIHSFNYSRSVRQNLQFSLTKFFISNSFPSYNKCKPSIHNTVNITVLIIKWNWSFLLIMSKILELSSWMIFFESFEVKNIFGIKNFMIPWYWELIFIFMIFGIRLSILDVLFKMAFIPIGITAVSIYLPEEQDRFSLYLHRLM